MREVSEHFLTIAFIIAVSLSVLGIIYEPGVPSLIAFVFITISCSPLLIVGCVKPSGDYRAITPPHPVVFWMGVAAGFANVLVLIRLTGNSLTDVLSLEGALRIASEATVMRYLDGVANGNSLLMAFSLFLVCRLGLSVGQVSRLRVLVAFVPLLVLSIISTAKYPLYVGICFYIAGFFSSRTLVSALPILPRYIIVIGVGGILIGSLSMFFRGAEIGVLFGPLFHYVLAPFPAFGMWLTESSAIVCCEFGAFSFIGPLDMIGLVERQPGVFIDEYFIHEKQTNIMTAWKYLVIDYSILGPFLLNMLVVTTWLTLRLFKSQALMRSLELFVIFATLLSIVVTPFVHNSVTLALIASALAYFVHDRDFFEQFSLVRP